MVKLVLISDTHSVKPNLPDGDILVHAGDLSVSGKPDEIGNALDWLAIQPFEYVVFTAGNHDFFCEQVPDVMKKWVASKSDKLIYLNDEAACVKGINFWGSPITPWFNDWAFNRHRGPEISAHWDKIPRNTNVLITHGPPFAHLDWVHRNERVGCEQLLGAVHLVRPKIHVFGHIHESYGYTFNGVTHFYNAALLDSGYLLANKPWEVEYHSNGQIHTKDSS